MDSSAGSPSRAQRQQRRKRGSTKANAFQRSFRKRSIHFKLTTSFTACNIPIHALQTHTHTHTQASLAICFKWSGLRKTRKKWGNFDETIHFAFFIPLFVWGGRERSKPQTRRFGQPRLTRMQANTSLMRSGKGERMFGKAVSLWSAPPTAAAAAAAHCESENFPSPAPGAVWRWRDSRSIVSRLRIFWRVFFAVVVALRSKLLKLFCVWLQILALKSV